MLVSETTRALVDWDELIKVDPYAHAGSPGWFAEAGRVEEARRLMPGARSAARSLTKDSEWLAVLWVLGEGAMALEDQEAAAEVSAALEPYGHVWRVDSLGAACYGAAADVLGRLAAFLGRPSDAERWLTEALEAHRRAGASLLVEQTEAALAALGTPQARRAATRDADVDKGEFRRSGKVWKARWQGAEATVAHSKGMQDLAVLLHHLGVPDVESGGARAPDPAPGGSEDSAPRLLPGRHARHAQPSRGGGRHAHADPHGRRGPNRRARAAGAARL